MATIGVGAEAEVHAEQRQLLKALHWYDGIPIAMVTLAAGLAASDRQFCRWGLWPRRCFGASRQ